jgi:hypothetical protein
MAGWHAHFLSLIIFFFLKKKKSMNYGKSIGHKMPLKTFYTVVTIQ